MINLTPESADIAALPDNAKDHYFAMKQLSDGRICGVLRLISHWSLQIDVHEFGYEDKYCYPNLADAVAALNTWDGSGDPSDGWVRHLRSSRRRDPATGREWIAA